MRASSNVFPLNLKRFKDPTIHGVARALDAIYGPVETDTLPDDLARLIAQLDAPEGGKGERD